MKNQIVVMPAEPTAKAKQHIEERVAEGKCLCCDNPPLKRGLCYQCYYAWRRERDRLSSMAKKAEYDSGLIRSGLLLAAQFIRKVKNKTVFTSAADEVA